MIKIIIAIIACFLAVMFFIQNSDQVEFVLFIGGPLRIRLIFLLLTFFIIGYATSFLLRLAKENQLRKQIRALKNGKSSANPKSPG